MKLLLLLADMPWSLGDVRFWGTKPKYAIAAQKAFAHLVRLEAHRSSTV